MIQSLEKARAEPEKENQTKGPIIPVTKKEFVYMLISAFLLPVLAGTLPFWNVGLSVSISALIAKVARLWEDKVNRMWYQFKYFLES